ncbi:MAG: MFS transporter [Chloroflexi bacterium]|nr:MFS transporter [Chloroflexota bacterium]
MGGGAVIHLVLAGLLLVAMTERHWRPAPRGDRQTWDHMGSTLASGVRVIRSSRVLLGILVIALLGGVASESLDRLWPYHLVQEFDFPALAGLGEVGWFGVIQAGSVRGAIAATALAPRLTRLGDTAHLARSLLVITVMLMAAVELFALSGSFWIALFAFWATDWVRGAEQPLRMAWINRGLDPRSRATVLSLFGQADALGQLGGGPALGVVATIRSVRAALVSAAIVLAPTLPLYEVLARREGRIRLKLPR